ncbi:MAG: glycosyltransferase [Clostridia bacterium]|nr:glycosyltransferase [Clostridia bacterium]
MNTDSIELSKGIAKANALYRSKKYREALSIYEKVALRPGWAKLVSINIDLCRRNLNLPVKLTIIVPVFNTGKYLEQCLRSILNQTESSLEVIVINDGSTDNSLDIIQRTMKQDKRVVLINNSKPSGNPGTPRNQGIAIAKGKYLGFVDSDDWINPDYFARLLAVIEKDNLDVVFAAGYTNHLNGASKTVTYDARHFCGENNGLHGYHESFMIWDKIYRVDLIKSHSIKLGETKAAVDVPFIFKAYYLLKKAGFADTKGYNYRRESDSSVTVNFRKSSNCEFEIQAYKDVEKWCQESNVAMQYQSLVKFRKVSSYIYTLRVISPKEFHAFFAKIKLELKAMDSELIANLSRQLNRPIVFEKFKAIVTGNADTYLKAYQNDYPRAVPATSKKSAPDGVKSTPNPDATILPTFEMEGTRNGVLFFPDWSRTNPYQKLFYASLGQNFDIRVKGFKPEFFLKQVLDNNKEQFAYVHLHWLHALMDVSREDGADDLLSKLKHAKKLGYSIIYTAHNIQSHDGEFQERELRFRKKIAMYFDYVLVHGQLAKRRVIDEIGVEERKIHVMPHGTYQGYYPNHVTREAARRKLGIDHDKFVFLFFGNIKGYKGVDVLLDAFKKIRSRTNDVVLVIAGRIIDTKSESKIHAYASADPNILLNTGFIEDSDVQYYFNAADLVILPYKRILTSGAALLSVAFERPIIAPRSGVIPELIEDGKHGYMFDSYDDMLALMERAVEQQRTDEKGWVGNFDFSDLNAQLRWPLLTAHPTFSHIFSASPKTEDYREQRSPYRYALIRILGNDLPMRHSENQTYNNLKFTLENESEFDNCIKLWILNRITDVTKKKKLIDILSKHNKLYIDIPYEPKEFTRIKYCFEDLPQNDYKLTQKFKKLDERGKLLIDNAILRSKNNYIINNNGARNRALQEGIKYGDWILPWDGNCFVTDISWTSITSSIQKRTDIQYHIVPMDRLLDNQDALRPDYMPNPSEEPQIIFRRDAVLRFDEWLMYGLQPKVQLLKRLGVPGKWDKWKRLYPWRETMKISHGSHTHNYSWAGWVARLFSGNPEQERDAFQRALNRERGIISFIHAHERAWLYRNYKRGDLVFYDEMILEKIQTREEDVEHGTYARTLAQLERSAREYLANPIYSVIDKTTLPPSGNKQDYWHPAPYCWPNPASADGLPYIYKDGQRVPGTRMYEAESHKYDRTAIQRVFDETTALALAGHVFSNPLYTEKAAKIIRRWFIDEKTAMNPHLTYSQVVMGKNGNRGTASGLIETKDMYFFLDAVRMVRKSNFWSENDDQKILAWCKNFLIWLNASDQGQQEVATTNNHGVAFDLQTYALAAFIGDTKQMYTILLRALSRMKGHVDNSGMQPHEMKRTTTAHYTAFNLHLWFNLSVLLRKTSNFNLFNEERDYGDVKFNPLKKATCWVLDRAAGDWPFEQIDEFDKERYQHIYHTVSRYSPAIKEKYQGVIKSLAESKVVFFPHDGVAPFWTLQG